MAEPAAAAVLEEYLFAVVDLLLREKEALLKGGQALACPAPLGVAGHPASAPSEQLPVNQPVLPVTEDDWIVLHKAEEALAQGSPDDSRLPVRGRLAQSAVTRTNSLRLSDPEPQVQPCREDIAAQKHCQR